jgi:hypothetical protein
MLLSVDVRSVLKPIPFLRIRIYPAQKVAELDLDQGFIQTFSSVKILKFVKEEIVFVQNPSLWTPSSLFFEYLILFIFNSDSHASGPIYVIYVARYSFHINRYH